MPAPPYFSGNITPRKPISASLGMISDGKVESSSHSITWGAISPSANSRTVRRRCCCSSVREKSTICLYHVRDGEIVRAATDEHQSTLTKPNQGDLKSKGENKWMCDRRKTMAERCQARLPGVAALRPYKVKDARLRSGRTAPHNIKESIS